MGSKAGSNFLGGGKVHKNNRSVVLFLYINCGVTRVCYMVQSLIIETLTRPVGLFGLSHVEVA